MIFIIAILQAVLFYLFPTLIGRVIVRLSSKNRLSLPVISYFVVGGLSFYLAQLVVYYALHTIIPTLSFTPIFYSLIVLFGIGAVIGNVLVGLKDLNLRSYGLPALVSAILTLIFFGLWQIHSPYPFNWDMLEHQTLVNAILSGHFSFVTSELSDTFGFNGYSTIFHTLIATSQLVPSTNMLSYWQVIDLFHFFMVILVSYLLGTIVTEHKVVGYLSALLAAGIFDSSVSFTSLFFIPQTFTAVVFVFLFVQLISEVKNKRLPSWYLVAAGVIFLVLNHYVIGSVAAVAYVATLFYCKYRNAIAKRINRGLVLTVMLVLAIIAIIASSSLSLGFLNHGEAAAFNYTFAQKFDIMRQIYGMLLLIFVPLGSILLLRIRGEIEMMLLTIAGIFLAITLLQVPYIIKYFVLARFFIHLILAIGLYSIIRLMGNRVLEALSFAVLFIALSIIFMANAANWKELLRYDGMFTNIAPNEVAAANFLNQHFANSQALLISDPATQQILEPLSGINTQGGTYTDNQTRTILDQISKTNNATKAANLLYHINDQETVSTGPRLLVVSGRYYLWQASTISQKLSYSYNIWYPANLTLDNYQQIHQLITSKHFTEIYHNPTVAILEVHQ